MYHQIGLLYPNYLADYRSTDGSSREKDTCFLLINARILDFPIVYASAGFSKLTGFSRIEVLQKPGLCPFMHGPQTNKDDLRLFDVALKELKFEQAELILYKKNLNARWISMRLVPIRNEKDSVVLFLITFRDVTAYRQPVEEDLVANSALGAFAAASDAGSSWGRFARLVLSMVRQRNGSIGERSPGEARRDSAKSNEMEPKEVCTGESADRGEIRSHTVIMQTTQNVNNSRAGVDSEPPQDLKWSNKLAGVKMKRTKPEQGSNKEGNMHSILGMEDGVVEDETKITKKRTLFRKLIEPGKTVINSFSNDAISLTSNSKWLGTTRNPGVNMDFEDYSTNHWLSSDAAPRYRLEPPCPPKHVILHYSAFRVIWDWTILLLTGYTAIVVPLRLVVIPRPNWVPLVKDLFTVGSWIRSSVPEALAIADAVIDIVFCLDIVLNFHTSFVGSGGEVVAEPPVIRTNYLRGWFTLDLLSCLPYELIKYFWPVNNHGIHSLLDGLRIIRLLRIGRAARRIDQYLEYVSTLLLLMILCFFLLAHWFACAWYAVGVLDLEHKIQYGWIPRYFNDSLRPQDWDQFMNLDDYLNSNLLPGEMYNQLLAAKSGRVNMSRLVHLASTRLENVVEEETTLKGSVPLRNSVDKWSAYVTALYFSLSLLTTVGFGNVAAFTEAEKLLSICCMLIGALVYATIFGNITTIVQQLYATRTRYNEIMKGVKDFLRIHAVPQELGERVIDYITSSWSVNKGIDTAKVLNYCPKDMQADISVHLNRCVFNSHPAFRLASDGCRRSLAVNFQTLHTAPGDLIFHQGESVDQLCFIASGSLEVLQDDEVIAILGKGDVFGDPSWRSTSSVPSAASVRALTYCTLHTIKLERLREVLQFYHAFSNSFTRNLELNHNLCNRVIFRKLADVKREMELSMRRTQDPPLSSLPPGHPVRKLISRLRRPSQGLSTIVSGESSLDASDLESISGSTNLEQNKSRVSIANAARLALNRTSDLEFPPPALSCTSTPRLASPIHEVKQGTLQPPESGTTTPSSIQNGAQASNVPRTGLAQLNPARKWARLISKATHPKLQNLNEESFEESKRIPAENQPTVTVSTKPTLSTVVTSNKLDDGSVQTISVTQKGDPGCPNIYSTAFVEMETGLKLLGQTLNKTLLTMHAELRQQLAEVVKRIENLELQVGQMNQSITHISSVIPPTPTTSHYLAPPVETLEITRSRTDPFQTVRRKD